jgi:hypothetical protein
VASVAVAPSVDGHAPDQTCSIAEAARHLGLSAYALSATDRRELLSVVLERMRRAGDEDVDLSDGRANQHALVAVERTHGALAMARED